MPRYFVLGGTFNMSEVKIRARYLRKLQEYAALTGKPIEEIFEEIVTGYIAEEKQKASNV